MSPTAMQDRDPRGMTLFALAFGALFAAPLLADPITRWAGFYVFLLDDVRLQLVWAFGVLFFGGLPAYAGAWRNLRAGRISLDLLTSGAALAGYTYGAVTGVRGDPAGSLILRVTALLLVVSLLVRLRREVPHR